MTPVRHLLIAILVLALPLQGAVASSRWLCVATSDAASDVVSPAGSHGVPGGQAHAMNAAHAASPHAHAEDVAHDPHASPTAHPAAHHGPSDAGHFEAYDAPGITEDMSFLEMLDVVNEQLIHSGREAIAFDHDCREGI